MNKNKNFFSSFANAFWGIICVFTGEVNMRFHFMIGNLIIVFAYFYKLTATQWAILLLTICAVFCAEMVNTAIENAVNTATTDFSPFAKIAKNAAAGAVLSAAIFSLIIGCCLFLNPEKITKTLILIFTTPKYLIPCLLLGVFDILFLIFGKRNIHK